VREADLGEAIVRANQGLVTAEARAAFERARTLDPTAIRPQFYLALALSQEGKAAEAAAAWRGLLAKAPPDAPWVEVARAELAKLGDSAPVVASNPAGAPGPTASDVDAAASLSPEERVAMINGMVSELAARLESQPDDAEGWARLIRSYMVLGRGADAKAALAEARAKLPPDKRAAVDEAARGVGLAE
jgi:cytochrome c-type biogenesis protein CcmH